MSEENALIETQDEKETNKKSSLSQLKPWLIAIAVMLFLLLALNTYQMINDITVARQKAEMIETTEKFIKSQESNLRLLELEYNESVYKDESVETIYQQIFLSQEFTFEVVTMLVNQNNFLIQVLAGTP